MILPIQGAVFSEVEGDTVFRGRQVGVRSTPSAISPESDDQTENAHPPPICVGLTDGAEASSAPTKLHPSREIRTLDGFNLLLNDFRPSDVWSLHVNTSIFNVRTHIRRPDIVDRFNFVDGFHGRYHFLPETSGRGETTAEHDVRRAG